MDSASLLGFQTYQIVLSSAVIAALIAGVFNLLAVRRTHKRLLELEGFKQNAELATFRYTRVYNAIEELQALPTVDYNFLKAEGDSLVQDCEQFKRVVSEVSERYQKVLGIFERAGPLLDAALLARVEAAISEEHRQNDLLTEAVHTTSELPAGVNVITLMHVRQEAEATIRNAMTTQVRQLTSP